MRWTRFFLFLLSIAVGLGAGLVYGWVISPPPYGDLAPASLHADYKADYVLMVAEIYAKDANLPQALRRLTQLEPNLPPARSVAEALLTARDLAYDPADLELLGGLARAVQASSPGISGDAATLTPTPTVLATPTAEALP